jgi:HAD superfamily hydrolase (TIGR01509 family)
MNTERTSPNSVSHDVEAVIFDMDGLMLDTEQLDREHFRRAAADFGYAELESVYLQTVGRNWPDTRKHFQDVLGQSFPFDELRNRWRNYSMEYINEFGIPLKPGLEQLLERLERLGIPKAVATSTQRREATRLLDKVALLQRFKAVVAGDEVQNGKPNPDIFLAVAQRLNTEPKHCLVFEDSPAGIRAAHAAGMIPILVPDVIKPDAETLKLAYRVLNSLADALNIFTLS